MSPTRGNPEIEAIVGRYEELIHRLSVRRSPLAFDAPITMPQFRLLYLVALAGETHMSTLVDQLGVAASTVSGLVDRLVEHGFVTRRDDPADRRQLLVAVTPSGSEFLDRLRELGADELRELLGRVRRADLPVIARALDALLEVAGDDAGTGSAPERPTSPVGTTIANGTR